MSSDLAALILAGGIVTCSAMALLTRSVSQSLISLFYASMITGVALTLFGDSLAGLIIMVTFAGAISVLMLAVVLITGESIVDAGAGRLALVLTLVAASVGAGSAFELAPAVPGTSSGDVSSQLTSLLWQARPWDLLILVLVLGGAMVGVVQLLGKESLS